MGEDSQDTLAELAHLREQVARKERLEFSTLLEASPNAIIVAGRDGEIVMLNRGAEALFGYAREELISQPVEILIPKRFRGHHPQHREAYTKEPTARPMGHGRDLFALRKDGTEVPVEIALNPFESSQGMLVLSVFVDITERKMAEAALRESEERLQTVFENMTEGLVMSAIDGRLLYWNKAALEMHGFETAERALPHLDEFQEAFQHFTLDGRELSREERPLQRTIRGESTRNCTLRIRRRDQGWEKIFEYNGAIVPQPDGTPIAFLTITDITERKKAELEVRRSAEFNTTVLNSVLAQIAVIDREGRIIAVNDAWTQFAETNAGASGDAPRRTGLGANYLEVCRSARGPFAEGAEEIYEGLNSILEGRMESYRREYPCPSPKEERWFLLTVTPLRSSSGGAVVSHVDITQRKLAERAVQESEERFRALVDASSQLVWTADATGMPAAESPGWQAFTGQTYEETLGKGWMDSVHPDDRERARQAWEKATASSQIYEIEYRLRHREKGWRWMAVRGVPLLNPDGSTRLWVGMATDITEERESRMTIERQANFLDQANEAILVRDFDGTIAYWNKGAERMYGWTSEEALGRNSIDLLKADRDLMEEGAKQVRSKGEWNGEFRMVNKSGRDLTVASRWSLLHGGTDGGDGILKIDVDITAKQALEAQYLRAQRMESIGTLAGGIAHDLNNMLSPILMSVELLRAKLPAPGDQALLQMLEEGATRGADMVRQILTFARGVEGRQALIHPKHLMHDVCRILTETLLKQIKVINDFPNDVWLVRGDPTQLHQVLLNLCVNARDAMPNGGTLTLGAANQEVDANYAAMHIEAAPGPYVILSVSDTGTGIPEQIRDRIFEPFFTTKEIGKGTGLGLATSIAIIKSHGGFVNLYSEMGRGTIFKVYLPAEPHSGEADLERHAASLPRGNGEVILVTDDESSIREITRQTLEAYGYNVLTASDGAEGVAVFAQHSAEVAVVLTDLMMPIMDGIAMIHALRRMKADVPIIAASGLATEAQNHSAQAAGAKYFVPKPYTAEAILRLLHEALHPAPVE